MNKQTLIFCAAIKDLAAGGDSSYRQIFNLLHCFKFDFLVKAFAHKIRS